MSDNKPTGSTKSSTDKPKNVTSVERLSRGAQRSASRG